MWGPMNLSGGAAANFDYVTASSHANLPSSPLNNTFGLITAVAVSDGGFSIRAALPSSGMNAGDVVLLVGKYGTKSFEAFSGSGVYVYPTAAYQYVGGVWVSIEAYIYQASAWGTIWIYYFDNGTYSVVSGFTTTGSAGSCTLVDGTIKIDVTNGDSTARYRSWGFNESVDLTNYKTLKIAWGAYGSGSGSYGRFYLASTRTLMTSAAFPTSVASITVMSSAAAGSYGGVAEIDVESLDGWYVIHGGVYTPATVNRHIDLSAQQIWTE